MTQDAPSTDTPEAYAPQAVCLSLDPSGGGDTTGVAVVALNADGTFEALSAGKAKLTWDEIESAIADRLTAIGRFWPGPILLCWDATGHQGLSMGVVMGVVAAHPLASRVRLFPITITSAEDASKGLRHIPQTRPRRYSVSRAELINDTFNALRDRAINLTNLTDAEKTFYRKEMSGWHKLRSRITHSADGDDLLFATGAAIQTLIYVRGCVGTAHSAAGMARRVSQRVGTVADQPTGTTTARALMTNGAILAAVRRGEVGTSAVLIPSYDADPSTDDTGYRITPAHNRARRDRLAREGY